MIIFDRRLYDPCHITGPKTYIIDKDHFFKYNFQSFNFMNKRICVVNDRFFYFGGGRKLEIFHFQYEFPLKKTSILFIECDEIICNRKNTNGLCASILFKYMLW